MELMYECFPKHLCIGTARMKEDIMIDEEGEKRRANMKRSTVGRKKMSRRPCCIARFCSPPPPPGGLVQKQWMNYITNLTYTNNLSTTPWADMIA